MSAAVRRRVMESELRRVAELRRSVLSDFVFGGISAGALVWLAARVQLETPASQGVAAIVVTLFSLALLRSVANAMSVLETPCPRCDRAFFGGARMAIPALPLPPRACVHCGADLPSEIPAR